MTWVVGSIDFGRVVTMTTRLWFSSTAGTETAGFPGSDRQLDITDPGATNTTTSATIPANTTAVAFNHMSDSGIPGPDDGTGTPTTENTTGGYTWYIDAPWSFSVDIAANGSSCSLTMQPYTFTDTPPAPSPGSIHHDNDFPDIFVGTGLWESTTTAWLNFSTIAPFRDRVNMQTLATNTALHSSATVTMNTDRTAVHTDVPFA